MIAPRNDFEKIRPEQLWDRPQTGIALGCTQCPLRRTHCGGLHVDQGIWNCMTLCCQQPETCTLTCPAKPDEYLLRLWEVEGYELDPFTDVVGPSCPALPDFVPIVFHGKARHKNLEWPAVAFPLRHLFHQVTGQPLFGSREALLSHLRVAPDSRLVFTGVAKDCHIERYWDNARAAGIVQHIAAMAPDLVTVPNFTFYLNRPRHEDLHNRKRISIAFRELILAAVPTALHVNARTVHDFKTWVDYIRRTPAVRAISFEFGTGATLARQPHYALMLLELQRQVERPLTLIARGGLSVLNLLRVGFAQVVFLDSNAFSKARSRQRAHLPKPLMLRWNSSPTNKGECLTDLLAHNINTYAHYVANRGRPLQRAARRIA